VQFDVETEQRLSALAAKGGKQPDALIKEAVLDYLEDLKDYYAAEAASERIKAGKNPPYHSKRLCQSWPGRLRSPR
jgi:predicted DNA-binding protein